MQSLGILIGAGATLVFLAASGLWAERRFAHLSKLPLHYGPTGKPTRYGSRSVAIWLPTAILASVVLLNLFLLMGAADGNSDFGLAISSLIIVAAQVFILFLHSRWARGQA